MIGDSGIISDKFRTDLFKKTEASDDRKTMTNIRVNVVLDQVKDTVSLNTPEEKQVTYVNPLTDKERLDAKFLMLRELVANIFKQQGLTGPLDINTGESAGSNIIDIGDGKTADISKLTPQEAEQLVAEDGYWGVKQTSDRIFQQALAIAGSDPTKIDKMKEGILKGFEMAKKAFNGELPDISQQTLDAVMKKLDEWAKDLNVQQKTIS